MAKTTKSQITTTAAETTTSTQTITTAAMTTMADLEPTVAIMDSKPLDKGNNYLQ